MTSGDWAVVATAIGTTLVLVEMGMRIAALGVLPANRKPSTGMAWLLLVLFEPIIGLVAFRFFGSAKVGRERHERLTRVNALIRERTRDLPDPVEVDSFEPHVRSAVHLNRALGALPMQDGNEVALLPDYAATVAEMTKAVRAARSQVHVEFYIAARDHLTEPFFDAMADAAARGVRVCFLFDHLGSRGIPGHRDMLAWLATTEVAWHKMMPIEPLRGRWRRPDLRNHRKLVVVDGEVGFTGSLNLTEPGYNKPKNHRAGREWVELMVRVTGPVVASLDAVFASDWWLESDEVLDVAARPSSADPDPRATRDVPCQLVPSGPGNPSENNLRLFTTLIYAATERLSLTSPYFVPDESLLYAVTTAARRGVDVELFVSEQSDQFMVGHAQASFYRALLEAGVRIHLYPRPYVLHAKHFTVDDQVAVVGSSNMDLRSFALNYELSLMMVDRDVVTRLRAVQDDYRARSRELTLAEWDQRPFRTRYLDNVMRLTSALQ